MVTISRKWNYPGAYLFVMVAGYAFGGGHVLHMLCDLTVVADNVRFGQTVARVLVTSMLY